MSKLTNLLIPLIMISTGVISCTSQSLVRKSDILQQALLQHEMKNAAGQTGYTEIPTKMKTPTINTESIHTVNKATGKENDPVHGEVTTLNLIEKTETPAELEEPEEESGKRHIYNLSAEQQDKKDLSPVGLAHLNLGIAYAERDLIDQAILEFQSAIEANPRHLESHVRLGATYRLKGMTNEALSEFKKAIDIDLNEAVAKIVFNALPVASNQKVKTDVVKAHINLGNAYREEGKLKRSQLEYKRALELKPEHPIARRLLSEIYYSLGTSCLENKKYNNAIDAFNKVLALSPGFPQIKDALEKAHYNLGINYAQDGELNKAIIEFNKTMKINLNYAMLDKNNLNTISKDKKTVSGKQIHHVINRPDENVNNSTNGKKRKDNPHVEEKEGEKQIPRKIDVVEKMVLAEKVQLKTERSNEDLDKEKEMSNGSLARFNQPDEDKIVAIPADSPVAETDDNILANTYIVPGEIESTSGHRVFSYYITRNYNSKIGFNEAIKKYEDVIRKNPYDDNNAHHNLAYAYYSKALHLDDAIARRENSLENNQGFTVKRFYIHDIADDKEIDKISSTKHTATLTLNKESVALYNKLGYIHFKKGMFNDAIFEYKNALKIDPKYSKTLYNLAFSFLIKGSHLDIALRDNKKY
ncbi:MAG: tetratricopeptide repeat protein [Candidatus Scalindua sp.]